MGLTGLRDSHVRVLASVKVLLACVAGGFGGAGGKAASGMGRKRMKTRVYL